MAKRKAGYLEVPLDEGEHLKLNLKRHKIATCYDLRRYLRTLCSPERLQIRGQELKRWDPSLDLEGALKDYYPSGWPHNCGKGFSKPVRVMAVATWAGKWELYFEPRGQCSNVSLVDIGSHDSLEPYASFPWLPLKLGMRKGPVQDKTQMPATVFVKTLIGTTLELQVRLSATIDYTKLLIEERAGNPPDEQRLIYKGKQLEDGRTLQEYGCQDLDTLHLVTRLRGGMMHVSSGRSDFCPTLASFSNGNAAAEEDGVDDLVPLVVLLPSGAKFAMSCPWETTYAKIMRAVHSLALI